MCEFVILRQRNITAPIVTGLLILTLATSCPHQNTVPEGPEGPGFAEGDSGVPYIGEDLVVYPVWKGTPQGDVVFSVKANGHETGLYSDTNGWGMPVNFAYLNIRDGTEAQVEIEANFNFSSYKILPQSLGIQGTREERKIRFSAGVGQNITLVFDNNYTGAVIHVFVSPIDPVQPGGSSGDVIYFEPGYHDLYKTHGGKLFISRSNTMVYIAPGAVVNGAIEFHDVSNCKITGGGVLMMSETPPGNKIPLVFVRTTNCAIGNIIVNSRAIPLDGPDTARRGSWSTALNTCSDMVVDGYRVVSPTYASTDSLNIQIADQAVKNIIVKNSFFRACDDNISIKGHGNANDNSTWQTIEGISIFDCTLWSDANNAMVVGEESAAKYKNISFRNIDIIFSYDDKDNHLKLNERSVMSIVCLDGTYFSDITWDNIRVNNCQRLICMTFLDSFWFGSIPGHQQYPGGISGITFSNISSFSPNSSSIANEIRLSGYGPVNPQKYPQKYIEDITFDNVVINGEKLTVSYSRLVIANEYVRDLVFK
jgi:hypothetical protein